MTPERAAEIICKLQDDQDRIDLFIHFERVLNPHPIKLGGDRNEHAKRWQMNFAALCRFSEPINIGVFPIQLD